MRTAKIQCEWNTIDCHVKKNESENQKIGMEQFSYNYVRKTILARRCSSTGKCCSFGGASTYKNHRDLMIAKTKIIGRQWGFLSGGRIKC